MTTLFYESYHPYIRCLSRTTSSSAGKCPSLCHQEQRRRWHGVLSQIRKDDIVNLENQTKGFRDEVEDAKRKEEGIKVAAQNLHIGNVTNVTHYVINIGGGDVALTGMT